jgi:ABC-type nitrate/sulfonate/bicarbonate transport system substrate-binding protein
MQLVIVLVLLGSCGDRTQDVPGDLKPLTIGVTSFIGEAAAFIAEEKGFFEDNGLDVDLRVNTSGSESIAQLISGEVDIAHVTETPLLFALLDSSSNVEDRRDSIQIVANMIMANRIQKVVGRRDAGIESPEDIVGKRVGLAGGTQSEYHLDSFLLEYQMKVTQIDTVHMSPDEQADAIRSGNIDVAVTWEPQASLMEYDLGDNGIELATQLTYSTLWLSTVQDQFAEQNQDMMISYLESLRQAQIYIVENPEEVIEIMSERTGVPADIIADVISQIDYELNISEHMLYLLDEQQQWILREMPQDQEEIDTIDIINTRFMEDVYPSGITLIR